MTEPELGLPLEPVKQPLYDRDSIRPASGAPFSLADIPGSGWTKIPWWSWSRLKYRLPIIRSIARWLSDRENRKWVKRKRAEPPCPECGRRHIGPVLH